MKDLPTLNGDAVEPTGEVVTKTGGRVLESGISSLRLQVVTPGAVGLVF